MEILRKDKLIKVKRKNRGNYILISAVDRFIEVLERAGWQNKADILLSRPDADCVHSDGFYFFNIYQHRVLVLIVFVENVATIIWTGSHDEYMRTFKGNKKSIENWLRHQQYI